MKFLYLYSVTRKKVAIAKFEFIFLCADVFGPKKIKRLTDSEMVWLWVKNA